MTTKYPTDCFHMFAKFFPKRCMEEVIDKEIKLWKKKKTLRNNICLYYFPAHQYSCCFFPHV